MSSRMPCRTARHPGDAMRQLELFEHHVPDRPSRSAPEPPAPKPPLPPPKPDAAAVLARRLGPLLPKKIASLTLTDNRTRILSARPRKGALEVRIHRSFTDAPGEVLERVAEFLGGARGHRRKLALAAIRRYFDERGPDAEPSAPRRIHLDPVGRCHDLRELRDEVNRECFAGRLALEIGWGKNSRPRRRGSYSIRLGSYDLKKGFVRIHPVLDQAEVPRWVVKTIVFHEMLHAVIPPIEGPGRRSIHPPEFREAERAFPHYHATERWLDEHLPRLLGVR